MRTTKAITSIIAVLILLVIVLLVLFLYTASIGMTLQTASKDDLCKAHIEQRSISKSFGGGMLDIANSRLPKLEGCEVNYLNLSAKDFKEGANTDYNSVRKKLADEMFRCQKLFDRGELNPYSDWNVAEQCYICSIINFEGFDQDITYMGLYTMEHYVPDPEFPKTTYYTYQTRQIPTDAQKEQAVQNDAPLSVDTTYAVIFVFSKETTAGQTVGWGSAGIAGGAIIGKLSMGVVKLIPGVGKLKWIKAGSKYVVGAFALIGAGTMVKASTEHKNYYTTASYIIPYTAEGLSQKCTDLGQKPIVDDLDGT